MELECREPTINTPPHLSRYPKGIDKERGFGSRWDAMGSKDLILPDVDDLSNCVNAHSGQSEWDKKV
jgi:hypothetical protein